MRAPLFVVVAFALCGFGCGAIADSTGQNDPALGGGDAGKDAKPPIDTGDPTCNEGVACSGGSGCATSCSTGSPCGCAARISCNCGADGKLHCSDACDVDAAPPPDPCAGIDLPPCPPKCTTPDFSDCGDPCSPEGSACIITNYGDQKSCVGGKWECQVHAPLGTGCNETCR